MKKISFIASILPIIALIGCGNNNTQKDTANTDSNDAAVQEEAAVQVVEETTAEADIDWAVVMPEIVKNLPKEVVFKRFQGKVGPDSIEMDGYWCYPYDANMYMLIDDQDEQHYQFSAMAVPYADSDEFMVIANSQGGVDGLGTLLFKTLKYNAKDKKFSDISDKVPGVEPKVELLDLSWLSQHPDWVENIKNRYDYSITYNLKDKDGVSMVVVNFDDSDVCMDIDEEMYSTMPDWYDRLALNYAWNGKTFELVK